MKINGKHYHTIWTKQDDPKTIRIIDQRYLPFEFKTQDLKTIEDACQSIQEMWVRGAPLIGITAAYGMYLGLLNMPNDSEEKIQSMADYLGSSRPTAVNLQFAIDLILDQIKQGNTLQQKIQIALDTANQLKADEIENCRLIGEHGFPLIEKNLQRKKGRNG